MLIRPQRSQIQPWLSTALNQQLTKSSGAHSPRPESRSDFENAIICALPMEMSAVEASFDEIWDDGGATYRKATTDINAYTTGLICNHYVVLAYMPGMGKKNAASVAVHFHSSFPGVRPALLVGVCGGVPIGVDGEEIILDDVIISDGVVEYDFGRRFPGSQFVRRDTPMDSLSPPRSEIRAILAKLRSHRNKKLLHDKLAANIDELCQKHGPREFKYPGLEADQLFRPTYQHRHHGYNDCNVCTGGIICDVAQRMSCQQLGCDPACLISRQRLSTAENVTSTTSPKIHFGRIASGDTVMKSGEDRDTMAKEEGAIAFEMESAGIWDIFHV